MERRPVKQDSLITYGDISAGAIRRALDKRATALRKDNAWRITCYARFAMLHALDGVIALYYTRTPDSITERKPDYIKCPDSRYDKDIFNFLKKNRGPCVKYELGWAQSNANVWIEEVRFDRPYPGIVWGIVECDKHGLT